MSKTSSLAVGTTAVWSFWLYSILANSPLSVDSKFRELTFPIVQFMGTNTYNSHSMPSLLEQITG